MRSTSESTGRKMDQVFVSRAIEIKVGLKLGRVLINMITYWLFHVAFPCGE